jgi:hypothetical protein
MKKGSNPQEKKEKCNCQRCLDFIINYQYNKTVDRNNMPDGAYICTNDNITSFEWVCPIHGYKKR